MTLVDEYKGRAARAAADERRARAEAWATYRKLLEDDPADGDAEQLSRLAKQLNLEPREVELHAVVLTEVARFSDLADSLPEYLETAQAGTARAKELDGELERLLEAIAENGRQRDAAQLRVAEAQEALRAIDVTAVEFPGLCGGDEDATRYL